MGVFCRLVVDQYADLVDYWITFNEPHVFTMLTYCAGAWPGGDPNLLETATAVFPKGVFKVVMAAMADAHIQAYDIIHANRCLFHLTYIYCKSSSKNYFFVFYNVTPLVVDVTLSTSLGSRSFTEI